MNALATIRPTDLYTAAQINLIRQTVAKDCNPPEFDLFVTVARNAGLDPFRKQISAIVFSKNDAKKRRMSIITGIDGFRAIAARSGRYRPDEDEPEFTYDADLKGPTNPLGLVKAVVKVYIADSQRDGGWRPVRGVAYWDEFAPVKDEWAEGENGRRGPTGKQILDGNWPKMPRVMLAKCAEAQALRKAFPEDLSALYEGAELDRAQSVEVMDLTPSEQAAQAQVADRMTKIGGASGITLQFKPGDTLEHVPLGQVADRVLAETKDMSAAHIRWFRDANTHPLREFWARAGGDALELRKQLDQREQAAAERETQAAEAEADA